MDVNADEAQSQERDRVVTAPIIRPRTNSGMYPSSIVPLHCIDLTCMKRLRKRRITSFCAESLVPTDFINVSGHINLKIVPAEGKNDMHPPRSVPLSYLRKDKLSRRQLDGADDCPLGLRAPFPENTRGFLYYHSPSFAPPHVGQLRFRLTNSAEPKDFASGRDLLDQNGALPFFWPLRGLVLHQSYRPIIDTLLRNGLITDNVVRDIARLWSSRTGHWRPTLFAFDRPFLVNFNAIAHGSDVLGEEHGTAVVERLTLTFPGQYQKREGTYPFAGATLCLRSSSSTILCLQS